MTKKEARDLIFAKYGCLLLSRQQVAEVLNKSVATIDRWKKSGIHLEFKKNGDARNATIEYSIDTIADYIINNMQKVN